MRIMVTYKLNDAGQKASLLAGGNGKQEQEIIIDDQNNLLLPVARVSNDGELSIYLVEYQRHYFPHHSYWAGEKYTVGDALTPDEDYLDMPISSATDVWEIIVDAILRYQSVEGQLPALQAQVNAERAEEQKHAALRECLIEVRNEAHADILAANTNGCRQIEQIRALIKGKQRVRTAQITTIVND